jgi:hypothetical protein
MERSRLRKPSRSQNEDARPGDPAFLAPNGEWYATRAQGPDPAEQSATDSELRDAMDAKASTFRFRPCTQGTTEARKRRGTCTADRPSRHRAGGDEGKSRCPPYACVPPEARFIFQLPSPPSPASSSPSKRSWACQMGLRSRPAKCGCFFKNQENKDPIIQLLLLFSMCCRRQY